MSDRELTRARRKYGEFIRHFSVDKASHTTFTHRTPPRRPFIQVKRAQALERFLRENPSFAKFREQLSVMYAEIRSFAFDKELWGESQ
ncbi:MAG: hypothetical protein NTW96_19660 [Planctomycetia bacterium]|nr:hypothetical protein [Planctomycetia bacterium]